VFDATLRGVEIATRVSIVETDEHVAGIGGAARDRNAENFEAGFFSECEAEDGEAEAVAAFISANIGEQKSGGVIAFREAELLGFEKEASCRVGLGS